MQAAQDWLDNVQETQVNVYTELYDKLLELGLSHKKGLDQSDKDAVLATIADKTGQFTSDAEKIKVYVSREEKLFEKKQCVLDKKARTSIKEYYKAAQDLCQAKTVFMEKTKALEAAVKDENIFLCIIRQVQLPAVQVMVRMRSEEEALQGKTYQELLLIQHLPNYQKLKLSATDITRTMAAFMYYVLYKQLTGKPKAQQGCSEEF